MSETGCVGSDNVIGARCDVYFFERGMLSGGNQADVESASESNFTVPRRIKEWLRARWLPLGLFFATFVLYSPALGNHLTNWDDTDNILFNENFRGLGWQQLKWMWTSFLLGPYQPLSWMTLGLDYVIWGTDAEGNLYSTGFYLNNILLHSLNVLLVYYVGLRLLRFARGVPAVSDFDRESGVSGGGDMTLKLCAAFGALLFGWHPLRVESVAWATERRDVLSTAFLLGSLVWYLRMGESAARDAADSSREQRRAFHFSWLLYVASLLSKAMGMTLPVVLLILDVYPLRRLPADPREWFRTPASRRVLWQRLLEKVPFGLASACGMALALYGQRNFAGLRSGEYPLSARLAQSAYGLVWYCAKTVWPSNLCALYPLETTPDPREPQFWGSAVILAAACAMFWLMRRRVPSLLAAAAAYVVLVSPVIGLAQSGPQLVADRYSYLSCIPWAILAAGALWWWLVPPSRASLTESKIAASQSAIPQPRLVRTSAAWERFPAESRPGRFRIARAGSLMILVVLGGLTLRQLTFWGSSLALWYRVLEVADFNPIAHHNLGLVLGDKGNMEQAFVHLQKAIDQRPSYLDAFVNRAILYEREKRRDEAAADLRRAIELAPNSILAHYNLALVLTGLGDDRGVEHELQRASELDPERAASYREEVKKAREARQNETTR